MTTPTERFSEIAAAYAATMAPSLRPVAAEVVRRADLRSAERVLDVGTGTGNAAAMARGGGRSVIGIDGAAGMLEIARATHPDLEFRAMDFAALAFEDAAFDVVLAVHALLFADDQLATLREWLRVTRPGGRLSISVPGPPERTPVALYRDIYARHGIDASGGYPTTETLGALAQEAGWTEVAADADPATAIVLRSEEDFRLWREIGKRGASTERFTSEQHRALTDEMLAATPRGADGAYRIPFGALYLRATRPR